MKTNKEQHDSDTNVGIIKHTPEPWNDRTHIWIDDPHEVGISMPHKLVPMPDYRRACKCVNAMEGIEDPEEWVKKSIKAMTDIAYSDYYIEGLEKYKTACEGINPDNPMAVIEFLPDLLEGVNSLIQSDNFCKDYPATSRSLLKLLTKIQSK